MATPHLSYYFGRKVAEIRLGSNEEPDSWQIVLDPAVYIRNLAEDNPVPDSERIVGTAFLTGEGLDADSPAVLQFGFAHPPAPDFPEGSTTIAETVTFPPLGYEIHDATMDENYITPDEPVTPEDTLPADPSDDRVAVGPPEPIEEEG